MVATRPGQPPRGQPTPIGCPSIAILRLPAATSHPRSSTLRHFVFRYRWLEVFKTSHRPVLKTFAALPPAAQSAPAADLIDLAGRFNRTTDGTMTVPSEYLEVIVVR